MERRTVLIETYWNVKAGAFDRFPVFRSVLIETYWNVNTDDYCATGASAGINRNILECKYARDALSKHVDKGINRNILECKLR